MKTAVASSEQPETAPQVPDAIDRARLPRHIAVIMDGNGRWARRQGAARVFGHRSAIQAVRDTVEGCAEMGVEYLTLYAFSTENWGRPAAEVQALMQLLVTTIRGETKTLCKNGIRLTTIGDTLRLPKKCQRELHEAIELTRTHTRMTLTLALNYSGRWELVQAMQALAQRVARGEVAADDINEALLTEALTTHYMPDPELLIRTSGEMRISNFLLWQLAYTEIYITDVLWPDFRKAHLHEAIVAFQKRDRRFGKVNDNK